MGLRSGLWAGQGRSMKLFFANYWRAFFDSCVLQIIVLLEDDATRIEAIAPESP